MSVDADAGIMPSLAVGGDPRVGKRRG